MNTTDSDFAVTIHPGELRFNAAHFITYNGTCENLHGHNFHVRVDARGGTTSNQLVVDFMLMTGIVAEICDELHDKVLLASEGNEVQIEENDEMLHIECYDKRFVLPARNCYMIPVSNTTAELIAWYISERLLTSLHQHAATGNLDQLEVAVEEADRQWGVCRRQVEHAG